MAEKFILRIFDNLSGSKSYNDKSQYSVSNR